VKVLTFQAKLLQRTVKLNKKVQLQNKLKKVKRNLYHKLNLEKEKKTEDKPKRQPTKPGGGGDRPPREKPANPNKRVFDRRSGTGRGKENKKGGVGRGNWGGIDSKDELTAESSIVPEAVDKEEAPKDPSQVSTEEKVATTEVAPTQEVEKTEDEEEKTVSLEEWRSKQSKPLELPVPVRSAGEGVDNSAWKEYVALSRDDSQSEESAKKASDKKKKETAGNNKVRLDEVFTIKQNPTNPIRRGGLNKRPGGGTRDSPKSFRGGRGIGRPSGSSKNFSLNEEAFPSLSTKA